MTIYTCVVYSDVGNQDLCITSTYTCIGGYIHGSQDRHTVRGAGDGSERWNNTKACIISWFNIYFHDFHTVLYMLYHLRIARIFYSWQWFLAVARKLVLLVSHSG
jgi:hypothetical protein